MPIQSSPKQAPNYVLHREAVAAADTVPHTERRHGMAMEGYEVGLVQIVPSGGANPNLEVLFWSEAAGAFIKQYPALAVSGIGANTPQEYAFNCYGRAIFVSVTAIAAGAVDVYVAASAPIDR